MNARAFGPIRPVLIGLAIAGILAGCAGAAAPVLSTVGNAVGAPTGGPTEAPPAPAEGEAYAFRQLQPESGGTSDAAYRDDAKIIRTGTLSLEIDRVLGLDSALRKARVAIVGLGGYVSASDQASDGERSAATVTYRIPADRWDDALDALRGLAAKVLGEQTNSVEVTGQIVDLGARITNLRATEAALQAIMVKATKISDILDVQRELTEVRSQIEQLTAQKVQLEDQAALGTLTVTYTVAIPAVTTAAKGWDPAAEIDRAIASLVDVLQGVGSVGIWVAIVGLPILVSFALLVAIVAFVVRRVGFGRGRAVTLQPTVPPASPPAGPATA